MVLSRSVRRTAKSATKRGTRLGRKAGGRGVRAGKKKAKRRIVARKNTWRVLFACIGNASRSQMAEGFARKYGGDKFEAYSAGVQPSLRISSRAVEVMKEKGIDISPQFPKKLTPEMVDAMDLIVTMGCGADACPSAPAEKVLEWDFKDPIDSSPEELRDIRDDIEAHVKYLVKKLSRKRSKRNFNALKL